MGATCHFTGRDDLRQESVCGAVRPVSKGGFGLKPTGITRRTFKPNLQTLTAVVDGRSERITVSTRAIRQGLVVKPLSAVCTPVSKRASPPTDRSSLHNSIFARHAAPFFAHSRTTPRLPLRRGRFHGDVPHRCYSFLLMSIKCDQCDSEATVHEVTVRNGVKNPKTPL